MKREPNYRDRLELLAAIEDQQHRLHMAKKLGEDYAKEADRLRDWINNMPLNLVVTDIAKEKWHQVRDRMEECRKQAGNRERAIPRITNEIERLKRALAQLDTPMLFPGMDNGVKK